MVPERTQPHPADTTHPATASTEALPIVLVRLARLFPRHLAVSSTIGSLLLITNLVVPGGWWTFWPMLVLAGLIGLHFLIFKAVTVDDAWAAERAEALNIKSYDRGHIDTIADRHR
jgi:hypothetical protein